jgi:hypothetical protein
MLTLPDPEVERESPPGFRHQNCRKSYTSIKYANRAALLQLRETSMSGTDAIDPLMNLAEIAAAFAGFAALVSVLRDRSVRIETAHNILRLRIVISTSVLVVAASLIPVGLMNFELTDSVVWRVSAVTTLVLNYGIITSFVRSYEPVQGKFPVDHLALVVVGTMELLDQAALLAVILNFWPGLNFALFFVAMVLNLLQAAFVFVRFVGSEFAAQNL